MKVIARTALTGLMICCLSIFTTTEAQKGASSDGFVELFNGENWDGWYLKLRDGDRQKAEEVFAIDNGEVHVFRHMKDSTALNTKVNATHGLFYTNKTYSKYILRFEYKWGKKITNNFDRWQYDAGVYFHVSDDKVWPVGIEYQIRFDHTKEANHTGDLIRPKGADYQWYHNEDTKRHLSKEEGGVLHTGKTWMHLAKATANHNGLNDEWNQCEIIVMGDEYVVFKLNGDVVNVAHNLAPAAGVIGFQAETAEIFYRGIEIKEFDEVPPIGDFLK